MKLFFRLIGFSKPYSSYLPQYLILVNLGVLFGALNFTLLIPLLDVLFSDKPITQTISPEFEFSLTYLKDTFYYFTYRFASQGKENALFFISGVIIVSVFFSNLFKYLSQKILTKMRVNVIYKLRRAVFYKLSEMDLGFFTKQRSGQLMSVISNDIQEIETTVVNSIQIVFREPFMIVAYFTMLFFISYKLTLFTLFFLPVSGFIISQLSKQLRKRAAKMHELLGNILGQTQELILGLRIIKGTNATGYIQGKFDAENMSYANTVKNITNKRELASPLSEFLGVSVVVCIIIYGGKMVLSGEGELTASAFITYLAFYSQILPPAKNISSALSNIQRGLVAGERIFDILDSSSHITEKEYPIVLNKFNNSLEFKDVCFSYESEPVLANINFKVDKGKTVALVGHSGAGKSTIADLIPRFYDVSSGAILIDNVDIRDYEIKSLRNILGIVTQESILFNDSVHNNIAFGILTATRESVIEAARIANADEFIVNLENGYDTNIGDRGGKLSGGQRQRLSIARAILKNPPILILDEATSALDTESERLVQDALRKLMQNRTSIIIAHRLSTIQHADEIIVLHQGQIVERGTHQELLSLNGQYTKLHNMQAFIS